MKHVPPARRDRLHRRRRNEPAHRRQQLLLGVLVILALGAILVATLFRSTTPQDIQPTQVVQSELTTTPTSPAPSPTAANIPDGIGATEPSPTPLTPTATPIQPANFFNDQRFSCAPDFYQPQIQSFLDAYPGPLKNVRFQIGDRSQSFAEVLVGMSVLYNLNPQILLALIEQQSSLLSDGDPSVDQINQALGISINGGYPRGIMAQLRWAGRELRYATRDYAEQAVNGLPPLVFANNSRQEAAPDIGLAQYAIARVLARTTTPERLLARLNDFFETYAWLFDDPRQPPTDWPPPSEPFLTLPMEQPMRITSFFDHDTPFLRENGSLVSYWGNASAISYDGHTGFDYAMRPPDPVLAAADGTVVFAGNSDDGCATLARAVIIDHGNGYRTLYWHLHSIGVETGQTVARGDTVGVAGETGCAFGPHLHFQVQYLGRDVDPYGWCGSGSDPWAASPAGQASDWLWMDMLSPCDPPPADAIIVDESDPGFTASGEWQPSPRGYGGTASFGTSLAAADPDQPWRLAALDTPLVAIWQPAELPEGRYRVQAYIPYVLNGYDESRLVRYQIRHRDGVAEVIIDQERHANGWADLGVYNFDAASRPLVSVSTLTGDRDRGVWADAIAFLAIPDGDQ